MIKKEIVAEIRRIANLSTKAIFGLMDMRKCDLEALFKSLQWKTFSPKIEVNDLCSICQSFPIPMERPKFGMCKTDGLLRARQVVTECDRFVTKED